MGFAAFTFFVIFLLIASGGFLLFYRAAMLQRISTVVTPRARQAGGLFGRLQRSVSVGSVVGRFERIMPKSQAEVSVAQQRLIRAGYRNDSAVSVLYGAKVLVPISLCLLVVLSGVASSNPFIICAIALALGYLAPDFWLGRKISKRQKRIQLGLPDVLDLLVICMEAGQSLDQATARTAEELSRAKPEISDELGVVVLEQRAGRPRADAWRHFAERTGVDSVRNLVSVLVQSEQFGTSIAKTLRIHSDTLRVQRRQQVEERAAKTTVKLVFPLVFFIFPSIFLVALGPAAIIITEQFKNLTNH
jgi:tight adherence protein C